MYEEKHLWKVDVFELLHGHISSSSESDVRILVALYM